MPVSEEFFPLFCQLLALFLGQFAGSVRTFATRTVEFVMMMAGSAGVSPEFAVMMGTGSAGMSAELAVMMRTGSAMGSAAIAMTRAGLVMSVLFEAERRTAFFHIRRILFNSVVILQPFLLGCGVFRFGGRECGTCQYGC